VSFSEKRRAELSGVGLGAWATAAQVVLLREALAVSAGDEVVLGLAFTLWLLGVAAGAALAVKRDAGESALFAAQLASGPIAFAALVCLRFHRAILHTPPGALPSTITSAALLAAALVPLAAAVGFSFTAAAKSAGKGVKRPAARIYIAEASGALAVGLAYGLALGVHMDHATALAIAFGAALALFGAASKRPVFRRALLGLGALFAVAALSGSARLADDGLTRRAFAMDPTRGTLVAATDSAYGRLALGEMDGQYTLFADGRPIDVFPDPWERPVQIHLALTAHPHPKSALLVGGGAPDRLAAALSHGLDRVVLTYLDGAEHVLCAPFLSAETRRAVKDPRVTLVRGDGRRTIETTREKFDAVVIASPPPRTGRANRYYTAEFFAAVRRALNPGGIVSLRAPGGDNVLADEAARATASTLRAVEASFPATLLSPGPETIILAAVRPGDLETDPAVLETRFESRVKDPKGFVPERFADLLHEGRKEALRKRLVSTDAPMNIDARPYAYLAGIELRERQGGSDLERTHGTVLGFVAQHAPLAFAIPLGLWFAWRATALFRRRRGAGDALFSIATTGAAGMAVEMMILYAFQTAAGVLYAGLAGIIASFMIGLAGGAVLGARLSGGGKGAVPFLADAAVLAMLVATGPALGAALESAWIAVAWSALAGAVTGAAFPAFLASAAESQGTDERKSAGPIETADHLGAAFGALVTGLVLLPIFGLAMAPLPFAALKAASLLGSTAQALSRRGSGAALGK